MTHTCVSNNLRVKMKFKKSSLFWAVMSMFAWKCLPDITGRTALAVRPDVVKAKYHVITNATYNRDPVPAEVQTRHEY